jgi:hypothetical protein
MNINKITHYFDLKTNIIIVLAGILVFFIVFKKVKPVDKHKDEITVLHKDNVRLKNQYDSLSGVNDSLTNTLSATAKIIYLKEVEIELAKDEINKLKNKKNETHSYIFSLSADSVSREFTKYLQESDHDNGKSVR